MNRALKNRPSAIGRCFDALVLIAWISAIVWLLLTGNDKAFLHPRFRLFLMGGAIMLTAFCWATLAGPQRRNADRQLTAAGMHLLVLMAPLVCLATIAGQGMGVHALTRKYTGMEQQTLTRLLESEKDNTSMANPMPDLSLLDIARRMKQIDGRRVITEGLVYRPDIMPENYLTLFRFAIFCCAADALPVWVFVEKEGVEAFDDENWIRVDGTVHIVNFNGTDVPVVRADTIVKKPAPPPGEQYLFF